MLDFCNGSKTMNIKKKVLLSEKSRFPLNTFTDKKVPKHFFICGRHVGHGNQKQKNKKRNKIEKFTTIVNSCRTEIVALHHIRLALFKIYTCSDEYHSIIFGGLHTMCMHIHTLSSLLMFFFFFSFPFFAFVASE